MDILFYCLTFTKCPAATLTSWCPWKATSLIVLLFSNFNSKFYNFTATTGLFSLPSPSSFITSLKLRWLPLSPHLQQSRIIYQEAQGMSWSSSISYGASIPLVCMITEVRFDVSHGFVHGIEFHNSTSRERNCSIKQGPLLGAAKVPRTYLSPSPFNLESLSHCLFKL